MQLTQEQFDEVLLAWAEDHVLAVESLFSVELTDQQKDLVRNANSPTARVAVASCTGSGKTAVLSMLTFVYLMVLPDCRLLITSPSFNQLVRVFSAELEKWYRKMPQQFQDLFKVTREKVEYLGSKRHIHFASLVTASVENKESLQGGHSENYVILADEASGISQEAFDILLGTLSTGKGGRFIQVSNPVRSSGRFYEIFTNKHAGKGWETMYFSAFDSPNVNKDWIDEMKNFYGVDSDLYRMRVLGRFPRVGASQFISGDIVEECIRTDLPYTAYHNYPKVMGVDIARFGDDATCFIVRQGPKLIDVKTFRGLDTMEVAAKVAEYQGQMQCSMIYIDAIGIGAGTYDRLKELGLPVKDVIVSSKSTEPNMYLNLRAQLWGRMRQWLENGADLPMFCRDRESNLAAQLTSMEYGYNNKMQIQLMAKRDLKKLGHPSPDIADALSLTWADSVFDIKPRTRLKRKIKNTNFMWA